MKKPKEVKTYKGFTVGDKVKWETFGGGNKGIVQNIVPEDIRDLKIKRIGQNWKYSCLVSVSHERATKI